MAQKKRNPRMSAQTRKILKLLDSGASPTETARTLGIPRGRVYNARYLYRNKKGARPTPAKAPTPIKPAQPKSLWQRIKEWLC